MHFNDRFGFFDPSQPYSVNYGQLPHWEQEGATYFITFRTADSLPASVLRRWQRERDDWLMRELERCCDVLASLRDEVSRRGASGLPWHLIYAALPAERQRVFHRLFAAKLEANLDECHGECLLERLSLAKIVADALLHFDGRRYHLGDFVVMPNHVHLLVCFLDGVSLREQCYSWKHFVAREINSVLARKGTFWQKESFDHLVRDADHFDRFRRYIADNPLKIHLRSGECIHYRFDAV